MYFDKETDFNFLTLNNDGKIVACSSQTKGCSALNTLNDERKVKIYFYFRVSGFLKVQYLNILYTIYLI
jgi:hypothetical protein